MMLEIRRAGCRQTDAGSEHYWIFVDTGSSIWWLLDHKTGDHLVLEHERAKDMIIRIGQRPTINTDNWTEVEPE